MIPALFTLEERHGSAAADMLLPLPCRDDWIEMVLLLRAMTRTFEGSLFSFSPRSRFVRYTYFPAAQVLGTCPSFLSMRLLGTERWQIEFIGNKNLGIEGMLFRSLAADALR